MPKVNFGSFLPTVPAGTDQLVGFRDTSETRLTISSLTALNLPFIDSVYYITTIFATSSANYQSTFLTVSTLSSNWSSVYSFVNSNSALNALLVSAYTSVCANSGFWNQAYSVATSVSSTPVELSLLSNYVYDTLTPQVDELTNSVNASAAYWSYAYEEVDAKGAGWDYAATSIDNYEGDWLATTNIVNDNFEIWNETTATMQYASGNWESTYITVTDNYNSWNQAVVDSSMALSRNGGALEYGAVVTTWKTLTSDFVLDQEFVSKAYVDIIIAAATTISGNFVPALYYSKGETYSSIQIDNKIDIAQTTLSRQLTTLGTLSGKWEATSTVVALNSSRWSDTKSLSLSSRWESNYTTFNSQSARLDSTNTAVRNNSGSWVSTTTTVSNNSASWKSVDTTTRTNSSDWSTAYITATNTTGDLQAVSAKSLYLESNIVEVTNNIIINSTTQSLYSNKILHVQSDVAEITITFALPLSPHFCTSIVNLGTQDVLLLPNDGSVVKAVNYRIYGNQYATVSLYKYKNLIYAIGTVPATS